MNHHFALKLTDTFGEVARIRGIANFMGLAELSGIEPPLKGDIVEIELEIEGRDPVRLGDREVYERISRDDSLESLVRLSIMDPSKVELVLLAYGQGDSIFSTTLESPVVATATVYSHENSIEGFMRVATDGSAPVEFEVSSQALNAVSDFQVLSDFAEEISVCSMLDELVSSEIRVYMQANTPMLIQGALDSIKELSSELLVLAESNSIEDNSVISSSLKQLVHTQKSLDLLLKGSEVQVRKYPRPGE